MCEACDTRAESEMPELPISSKRRRLWELTDGWHCSVIGTCLTLADLRALGRKLKLKTDPAFPHDYQLHGFFAAAANKQETAAKLLGKLLDKRHAVAIRRLRDLEDDDAIKNHWEEALSAGDIPGPYWAMLTDPRVCSKLCERMFADVHMLSHLVGASNRADIRQLQSLEEENDALWRKMQRMVHRHRNKVAVKNAALEEADAEINRVRAAHVPASLNTHRTVAQLSIEPTAVHELETTIAKAQELTRNQAERIEKLSAMVLSLKQENQALEQELAEDLEIDPLDDDETCPFDLGGRCVLYVGGRKHAVARLKALVEAWNGELLHHDGGLEKSVNELAGAIIRADAVVFPTDCVSHEAMNKVKKLCRQTMKPYVPLRSSGVGSLIAGLQSTPMVIEHMQGSD